MERTASRARCAPATRVAASTLSGSSGFPARAAWAEGRRGGERVGVPEPLGLGGELGVLAGQRLDGGDLVEAEPQQIGLLGALARPGGQLLQLAATSRSRR